MKKEQDYYDSFDEKRGNGFLVVGGIIFGIFIFIASIIELTQGKIGFFIFCCIYVSFLSIYIYIEKKGGKLSDDFVPSKKTKEQLMDEYVIKNKELIKNIYSSGSKEYFLKFVYKQTNLLIINFIEKEYKDKKIKDENKKFIANFYKYGFVGVMEDWIENGMKENPEKIVSKLNNIIEGDIGRALEKLCET